jgi:hypothetical protein
MPQGLKIGSCLQESHEELMKVEVLLLEATSDLQTLRHRNIDSTKLLETKRREAQE